MTTYYLDASLQRAVREAVAGCRDDVLYAGGPNAPTEATKDRIWLEVAGREGWVVIMRDKRIRRRVGERQALVDAGVRAFCLTSAGNATRWQVLELLVARWRRIEQIGATVTGPYIYAVTTGRVERLKIPGE